MNTPEPNLPVAEAAALIFWYKNYRGTEGYRRVIPISIRFGVSEWHGEKPQWLMLGIDTEKSVGREFAMSDMKNFVGPAVIRATPIPDTSAGERETIARALLRSRGAHTIAGDEGWASSMAHYRDMCARYPDYADGSSLVNDVLRDADTMLAALAPPSSPGERMREALEPFGYLYSLIDGEREEIFSRTRRNEYFRNEPWTETTLYAAIALQGPSGKTGGEG